MSLVSKHKFWLVSQGRQLRVKERRLLQRVLSKLEKIWCGYFGEYALPLPYELTLFI